MSKYFRPLLKKELAGYYQISVKTLNRWINEYPALSHELSISGNYKYQKIFTLRQILIIYKYLGYPEEINVSDFIKIPIKSFTKKELASLYNISVKTLRKMIENTAEISHLNDDNSKKYSYRSVLLIFEFLGWPVKILSQSVS